MRVTVDEDRCLAAGLCTLTARAVFAQAAEDGVVVLLTDEPAAADRAAARTAAGLCPGQAITIADDREE